MRHVRAVVKVARHDLLDLRRQRGVWVGLLLIPFVTVSFLLLLPGVLTEREQARHDRAVYRVAVEASQSTGEAVTALATGLPTSRFRLIASTSARGDVTNSKADVGLRFDGDVSTTLAGTTEPLSGDVLFLASRSRSRAALGALAVALDRFGLAVSDRRLAAEGLPPATVRPFVVEAVDLTATERGRRLNLATLLPLLVLLPVAGIIGVSAQRISGSKDQRVFEPMLVLPFTRPQLLLGKALAALAIGSVTLVAVGVPLLGGRYVPIGVEGRPVALPLPDIARIVAVGFVLLVLLVLLGVAIGAASRTSAELASVLQLATLPIFLLGSFLQLRSGTATTPALLVLPFFGPLLCVRDVAVGTLSPAHLAIAVVSSAAWGAMFLVVGARLLESERSVVRSSA